MDWALFWTAFQAIGTTLGSIITAIAVMIAVKQYKQPLEKRLIVEHGTAFGVGYGLTEEAYVYICVKNCGMREASINGFYLKNKKKKFYINQMQSNFMPINFPYELKPEEKVDFYVSRDRFINGLKDMSQRGLVSRNENLCIFVQDSLGKAHFDKKTIRVKNGEIK